MVLCTEKALVKHEGSVMRVRPLRCKCWGCSYCVHQRRRALWWKAFNGKPQRFLTLTMKPGVNATPDEQARAFIEGWRLLRQFLCRRLGVKHIAFLAVFEAHESGWPHLHILLRGKFIHHRLIRQWWEARFDSFQIDIRYVKNQRQQASYVSKYVSSAPTRFEGCRRWWCSQDWDLKPESERPVEPDDFTWWQRVMTSPLNIARMALSDGAEVVCEGDQWVIRGWWQPHRQRWGIG